MFIKGDLLIYLKSKRSDHPGPRAKNIHPVSHGDDYHYTVEKYWRVIDTNLDKIFVKTRRGKVHKLSKDDPHIVKPNLLKSFLLKQQFPALK